MFPMHGGFMGRKKGDVGLPFIFTVTVGSGQSFQLPTVASGSYDAIIEWGDTTSNALTVWNAAGRSHTYITGGTYEIRISGIFIGLRVANYVDRLKITEIKQWGILHILNGNETFLGCSNLTITASELLDTSHFTTMRQMFMNCSSITTIPGISLWDTSSVENMRSTFRGCANFNSNLNLWDVSSVTAFAEEGTGAGMFSGCTVYNQPMNNWNVSSARNFRFMFFLAAAFNQDLSNWNPVSATNFQQMFQGATSFDQNVGDWTVENVTNMIAMFRGTPLSTANYDSLLIGWAAQSVNSDVSFEANIANYTNSGAALAARTTLITTYGWKITDGGPA